MEIRLLFAIFNSMLFHLEHAQRQILWNAILGVLQPPPAIQVSLAAGAVSLSQIPAMEETLQAQAANTRSLLAEELVPLHLHQIRVAGVLLTIASLDLLVAEEHVSQLFMAACGWTITKTELSMG